MSTGNPKLDRLANTIFRSLIAFFCKQILIKKGWIKADSLGLLDNESCNASIYIYKVQGTVRLDQILEGMLQTLNTVFYMVADTQLNQQDTGDLPCAGQQTQEYESCIHNSRDESWSLLLYRKKKYLLELIFSFYVPYQEMRLLRGRKQESIVTLLCHSSAV